MFRWRDITRVFYVDQLAAVWTRNGSVMNSTTTAGTRNLIESHFLLIIQVSVLRRMLAAGQMDKRLGNMCARSPPAFDRHFGAGARFSECG